MSGEPLFSEALCEGARAALLESLARAKSEGRARTFAATALSHSAGHRVAEDDLLMRRFGLDEAAANSAAPDDREPRFALFQPDRDREWLARGECRALDVAPEGISNAATDARLDSLASRVADCFAHVDSVSSAPDHAAEPLLVGGLAYRAAFDEPGTAGDEVLWKEFGAEQLWLPRELWVRSGSRLQCTLALEVNARGSGSDPEALLARLDAAFESASRALFEDADAAALPGETRSEDQIAPEYCAAADRPHAAYCDGVARAVGAIERGEFSKVVLARSLGVRYANGTRYDGTRLLRSLRAANPSCTTFAVARPATRDAAEAVFLGASPELLARVENGSVETLALAGSAPRGRSPQEDESFGLSLVDSAKQQAEHRAVVDAIRGALDGLGLASECADAPQLRKFEGIQHLATPIVAKAGVGQNSPAVAELVGRLHPTPAVCGTPRASAESFLREHEDLERGWYAGPVGFVGGSGEGEFHVALRSGVIRGTRARLFAGAGIVEGSDPAEELAETRIKLRTLLAPLTEI